MHTHAHTHVLIVCMYGLYDVIVIGQFTNQLLNSGYIKMPFRYTLRMWVWFKVMMVWSYVGVVQSNDGLVETVLFFDGDCRCRK